MTTMTTKERAKDKPRTPPQVEVKTSLDPLLECFRYTLSLQGMTPDLQSLTDSLPQTGEVFEPSDLQRLAEKMNVSARIKKIPFGLLQELVTPVILLLQDRKAVVYLPGGDEPGKLFASDTGLAAGNLENLRNAYLGHAILVTPKGKDQEKTEHMWKQGAIDWFWAPINAYWQGYAEIIVCSLFINLFIIAMPLFTMNVYDRVVPNFAVETLQVLTIGITLAFIFDFLFRTIRAHILEKIAAKLSVKFDRDLMAHLIDLPPEAMSLSIGEKANIFKELQGLRDFYSTRLVPAFVDLPFTLLFLIVIYLIAPSVSFVPVLGIIMILGLQMGVQSLLTRRTKEMFSSSQSKSAVMVEMLGGLQTIRMFGAGGARLRRWHDVSERSANSTKRNQSVMNAAANISNLVMTLVNIFVVFFGVYAIQAGDLSVGGLIAVTILAGRAIAPVTGVAAVVSRLRQSRDVLKMIDSIFSVPVEGDRAANISAKGPFTGRMELQNVSYKYKGQSLAAVQGINLNISAGEKIGLIGQTGAGKSTLAFLLAGLIHPQTGTILYDGFAHDTILSAELRRSIGYVPQKSFFFSGTIRDNILMGAEDLTEHDFAQAAELSGLNMYIHQTGQGFDTEIGEGGIRLSGGQQQAIALARAMIRDPSILIFDEPTTGMDNLLEQQIHQNLKTYLRNKTFIMVTHRTTLLPLVERLILLTKGRLAADGPRDEVLRRLGAQPGQFGERA
ncbi:MAG: type I secretion system permease/ATPase [Alphaproteobacteria bacterium]|nr:MAG: type I secretion system permease/ATPase [Alphaproteobacteria bacterium]